MKRPERTTLAMLAVVALIAAGCSRRSPVAPPNIHYGLDTCADCGMVISDPHFAAALLWRAAPTEPARTAVFDDIGCLLDWRRHHPEAELVAAWVKDVQTMDWLNAPAAHYLEDQRLSTPMGWGVVAGAEASAFAALPVRGPVLTWPQLLQNARRSATGGDTYASDPRPPEPIRPQP